MIDGPREAIVTPFFLVPEPDIGKFALDQEARVYVDAYPDRIFRAKLTTVSRQAEFTPTMVETREQRVRLVFKAGDQLWRRGRLHPRLILLNAGIIAWVRPDLFFVAGSYQ